MAGENGSEGLGMTWEQKLSALQAIAECYLRMRKPGDWYVSHKVSIGGDGFLRTEYGNGKTPEEAVNNHWDTYAVNLPIDRCVVARVNSEDEKRVRWNGFMWEDFAA